MAGRIREYAPAKLNLTLDVLYRRDDGYHELESVMQSVSLCDVVDISISGEKGIEVDISQNSGREYIIIPAAILLCQTSCFTFCRILFGGIEQKSVLSYNKICSYEASLAC